jgi:hypothetical protein
VWRVAALTHATQIVGAFKCDLSDIVHLRGDAL